MNAYVKFIVSIIVSILKRAWYFVKMKSLKEELKQAEEEAKDAKDISDKSVDDFESAYRMFKSKNKEDE